MSKENLERLRAKRGGYRGVTTKLIKESLEILESTDVDIQRCEVISKQLEDKMTILKELNDEILGICEVSEIEHEIEEAAVVIDRILNTKSKIEAAKKIPNVGNVSVVTSPTISATTQIENSSNMSENTGNLATNSENSVTDNSVNSASNVDTNTSNIATSNINTNTSSPNVSAPVSPVSVPTSLTLPRLPKLELPKCSGKVTEWSSVQLFIFLA